MLIHIYKTDNTGKNIYNSYEIHDVEGKDQMKRSFKILVFEGATECKGITYPSFEFRAVDMEGTKDQYIILWVTKFHDGYQNTMIKAYGDSLREMGLPECLIYFASTHLQSDIMSSSTLPEQRRYDIDKRHDSGEKVWLRLKIMAPNQVSYSVDTDRYTFHYM